MGFRSNQGCQPEPVHAGHKRHISLRKTPSSKPAITLSISKTRSRRTASSYRLSLITTETPGSRLTTGWCSRTSTSSSTFRKTCTRSYRPERFFSRTPSTQLPTSVATRPEAASKVLSASASRRCSSLPLHLKKFST